MVNYSDNLSVKKFISYLDEKIKHLEEELINDEDLKDNLIKK